MRFQKLLLLLPLAVIFLLSGCQEPEKTAQNPVKTTTSDGPKFDRIKSSTSGVTFNNLISEDYNYNIFNYEYLYNGGGVAIGDINNDGLPDLYFTGTFVPNKLYLNKGNFVFEDITEKAGVAAKEGFKTGVTMADINGDGYLDIYVCRTSKSDDGKKNNHVFINNKDLTFSDMGAQFGLADNMNSNHASFFDYDLDGDLDLYLLNHRLDFTLAVKVDLQQDDKGNITRKKDPITPFESDKLYRNDGNGKFTDVSRSAGIYNSAFGLSATVADINQDGYPDIYVANDYIEPDYVYINNKNGTFTDHYETMIRHSSQNSMGSDIADINNDGLPDVVVLDMIADDPFRYKQLMNIMVQKRYNTLVKYGYGHQVSRNVLQLNNGKDGFSEIGQIAGVSNTDWSWGPLLADLDNDGWKDLYIANGYRKDVTDMDYMTYTRDSIQQTGGINPQRYPDLNDFMKIVPSKKLANYCFRNKGGWTYDDVSNNWGFEETSFSNGAAYGDLDADGDLDLVVNNIDEAAFIYRNNISSGNNYLQIAAEGPAKNPKGYGLQAKLTSSSGTQVLEVQASRGFFSASEALLHFGLGKDDQIDEIELTWPGGNRQILTNVKINQRITARYQDSKKMARNSSPKVAGLLKANNRGINFKHTENNFQDFDRETLLPSQMSKLGPHTAVGDVNNDKLDDLYVGGASNQAGALFIQQKNGAYKKSNQPAFTKDASHEDMGALFFDADNDGDDDLIIVSGGAAQNVGSRFYHDRLYLNDGKGQFSKSTNFPATNSAGSQVVAFDYDADNDKDLFIGGRCLPGSYPVSPKSYLLNNDGQGNFTDVSKTAGKDLMEIGMISDVAAADLDGDTKPELIISGEWLPISIFSWNGNTFENNTAKSNLSNSNGWWNTIAVGRCGRRWRSRYHRWQPGW